MRVPFPTIFFRKKEQSLELDATRLRYLRWGGLTAVVLLAAVLRLANLSELGLANHYYAAAVKSMLQSWHNFFYAAAEPGGAVSVDKPPVGLWLQVISASIFGVNSFGLLAPQIFAGLGSVVLVYHLVQRKFGALAGLLAALVLAITPVTVATDRNNTIDSTLIFTLLLTAWAFIRATETTRLRYLLLGALGVGIAFNIKMLEAYLPLPAFLGLYFLGAQEGFWRKLGKLALTGIVLLGISLSWAVAVDVTPASQRPFVGSSGNNSEMSLIIGYNGIDRLVGMFRNGSIRPGPGTARTGSGPAAPASKRPLNAPNSRLGGPFGTAGLGEVGVAGPLRLFLPPLSKEASWLLPFALFGLLLMVFGARLRWPIDPLHQAALVWGGWLITAGIFFSIAGFFHPYYLSTIAPPVAILTGIGAVQAWQMRKRWPWLGSFLIILAAALTLSLQSNTADDFVLMIPWLPLVIVLFAIAGTALLAANLMPALVKRAMAVTGVTGLAAAMLIGPGAWSQLTNLHPSANQSLPSAYDGRSKAPGSFGRVQVNPELLGFLQANTQKNEYLMAVPSSMQGSDYVLASGRPVLYMGGFMGVDPVLTVDSLASLVDTGRLRYIYWSVSGAGGFGPVQFGGQTQITQWIARNCQVVQGFNSTTHNSGAPDGTSKGPNFGGFLGGELLVSLYDCSK